MSIPPSSSMRARSLPDQWRQVKMGAGEMVLEILEHSTDGVEAPSLWRDLNKRKDGEILALLSQIRAAHQVPRELKRR
nr:unnamed protein product [Digitaria exilis]